MTWRLSLLLLIGISVSNVAFAGAFLSARGNSPNNITHPTGYTGSGTTLLINVCISTASENQNDMLVPTENAIRTMNALVPTNGNFVRGSATGITGTTYDYESVLLHELGHCVGLAHPNAATESGASNANQDATRAGKGNDGSFDFNAGADGIIGSSDDMRGDDVNLHWFRKSNNNPFTIASVVDISTYSLELADLPAGHNFAANADRDVGAALGFANTEAVMQQGTFSREAQRTLGYDDVATLRYGMSGLDEIQGTADDYSFQLNFSGVSDSPTCDITITLEQSAQNFAFCSTSSRSIPAGDNHARINRANISMDNDFNWFFNQVTNAADSDGDGILDAVEAGACTDINDADTDDDGLDDGAEDVNGNGIRDPGETDACDSDSDGDGIQDGTESGITSGGSDTDIGVFVPDADPATTTKPLVADSDNDGFDDGVEDGNANGQIDAGESDPNDRNSTPQSTLQIVALPVTGQLIAAAGIVLLGWVRALRRRSRAV